MTESASSHGIALDALASVQSPLRQVLDSAPDAMVIASLDGTIVFANKAVGSMFGYAPDELVGEQVEKLIPKRFRYRHRLHRQEYQHEPKSRDMGTGLELYALNREGQEFPVEVSLSPLETEQGTLVISAVRDVTDSKRAREALERQAAELRRSNAELEQFAYVASHDLQEPLRMLGSYAQLLHRRYHDTLDEEADEFIHYIVDGATRMQTLINDLLAYSRVGTRGKPFTIVDAGAAVGNAVDNLDAVIRENGATVTVGDLPAIHADSTQITQLFQNLISNGIKFHGEEPPRINVSASRRDNEYLFAVTDNGIGVEAGYADRIFLIFQRLHTRREYPGTGIGLAICKKIVERHGGRIWMESSPGEGSTFYVTLPFPEHADDQEQ